MSDIISSMRTIKLYAWEDAMASRHFILSVAAGVNQLVPFLIAFASFATFSFFSGRSLTPDVVFPCLRLFTMLRLPFYLITPLMTVFIDGFVSLKRLQQPLRTGTAR